MRNIRFLTLVLFVLMTNSVTAFAQIINVPDDFETIQEAIQQSHDGDIVLVAPGVYEENFMFLGRAITVTSHIHLDGDRDFITRTILDGGGEDCVVAFNHGAGRNSVLRGFTIRNGSQDYGGGIDCQEASAPILQDLIVTENTARIYGGGIYIASNAEPLIERVIFTQNSAGQGGGIGSYFGDGDAVVIIRDVEVSHNEGGGIFIGRSQTFNVSNSLVHNNDGFGITIERSYDNVFANLTVTENTEYGVRVGTNDYGGSLLLQNSIVFNNNGHELAVGDDGGAEGNANLHLSYCDIEGGEEEVEVGRNGELDWGEGNIDEDPLFVDADNEDYHLTADSPCIDTGDPEADEDPDGTRADMGAFYFHQEEDEDENPNRHDVPQEFETIQAAIEQAEDGDIVQIAPGEYEENIDFGGRDISIIGNPNNPADVVINGNNNGTTVTFENDETRNSIMYGVTVTGGSGTVLEMNRNTASGGGVLIIDASPVIRNCIIEGNILAEGGGRRGGGIAIWQDSEPLIQNCIIQNNEAGDGGGLSVSLGGVVTLEDVDILNNLAADGDDSDGGGIYGIGVDGNESQLVLTGCTISGNEGVFGTGIYLVRCVAQLSRCELSSHRGFYGTGIYSLMSNIDLDRVTIAGNMVDDRRDEYGVIYLHTSSVGVSNSIFYNPNEHEISALDEDDPCQLSVSYSLVEGDEEGLHGQGFEELNWGEGNIDADPLFADAENGDYHLTADSPCIDTGDPEAEEDPDETRADMGAFYFHHEVDRFPHRLEVPVEFETIQDAVNQAAQGDTVLLHPGVYFEDVNFWARHPSMIFGSLFITNGDPEFVENTIIDGSEENFTPVAFTDHPQRITLCGFTIRNGEGPYGGGIYQRGGGDITLEDMIITNCIAENDGGGAYFRSGEVEIYRTRFINNTAERQGGGLFAGDAFGMQFIDCLFMGNEASEGGGVYIHNRDEDRIRLTRCCIAQNQALEGAGLYADADLRLVNCTIVDNINEQRNAESIYFDPGDFSRSFLTNCIIRNPRQDAEIWIADDHGDDIQLNITYCDINGGIEAIITFEDEEVVWGEGNIDENPLFADAENGDYHLTENSPCIDTGDPEAEEDPDGTRADMGAFYFHHENEIPELQHFVDFVEHDIHHLINIENFTFDGEEVPDAWEIGAFTRDDVLAGAVVWQEGGVELPAYWDDIETEEVEGFYSGEYLLNFRAWNPENDEEYRVGFEEGQIGNRHWNPGRETNVSLWGNLELVEQQINFREGWNMVSLNVRPAQEFDFWDDNEFPDVVPMTWQFFDIRHVQGQMNPVEEYHHILVKDSQGRFYAPAWGFHNIPGWMPTEGYQILMDTDISGTWWGTRIDAQEPIELQEGWGIYTYYPQYQIDQWVVIESIIDHLIIAKDVMGRFIVPGFGFGNMEFWRPGQGYQICVDADCELVFPEEEQNLAFDGKNESIVEPQHWVADRTGSNMSVLVFLNDQSLPANCEIAAINADGQLLGSGVINVDNYCGFAVWGDDPTTHEIEGLREGEAFSLMLWSAQDGTEQELHVHNVLVGEGLTYGKDALTVVEVATISEIPTEFSLQSVYPNPFNNSTRITYALPDVAPIDISVYDIQGRLVKSLFNGMQQAGYQSLVWDADGVSSGIYFVRLSDGQTSLSQKVLLAR